MSVSKKKKKKDADQVGMSQSQSDLGGGLPVANHSSSGKFSIMGISTTIIRSVQ